MEFIYPGFLLALVALAIPILIHLFNFRKFKKVYFSNISFLKEVKIETQSRSRIRHILILLSRLLALAMLIFAFAQPFIPITKNTNTANQENVSIFIDNSFSMGSRSTEGIQIDIAKNKALDIVNQFDATDNFQLVTNDYEAIEQRIYNKEEIINLIDQVQIGPNSRNLNKIVDRQTAIIEKEDGNRKVFLLSDFQKATSNIEDIKKDSSTEVFLIPFENENNVNTYIDSIWFESPNRLINANDKVNFSIKYSGDIDKKDVAIKLIINGKQKASSTVNLKANSSLDTSISFVNTDFNWQHAQLTIDDYPITYDNSFYFSYHIAEQLNVLYVTDNESDFISPLFSGNTYFHLDKTGLEDIDYSSINDYSTIIIDGLKNIPSGLTLSITEVIKNGGNCVVYPDNNIDLLSYNRFLKALTNASISSKTEKQFDVHQLDVQHPLYATVFESNEDNMDLPVANSFYNINAYSNSNTNVLMKLKNDASFFTEFTIENGHLYFCASPLNIEATNLPRHALFVPTMLRIAETSLPSTSLYYTIGNNSEHILKNASTINDEVFKIRDLNTSFEFVPIHEQIGSKSVLFFNNEVEKADNYQIHLGSNVLDAISFNFNRKESESGFLTKVEIEQMAKNSAVENIYLLDLETSLAKNQLLDLNGGKQLWKWCLIFALIFLLCEIILIRIKK